MILGALLRLSITLPRRLGSSSGIITVIVYPSKKSASASRGPILYGARRTSGCSAITVHIVTVVGTVKGNHGLRRVGSRLQREGYLPSVSIFFFSSSFIFLTVGLWLLSPVVCVLVAGGLLLGTDVCSGPFFAGRAALVPGELACAAVVGVVAGVCSPPDFGMTVFFILVCGMSGLTSLFWANAGADRSNNAIASLYMIFSEIWL
jgi:hypothetical protein